MNQLVLSKKKKIKKKLNVQFFQFKRTGIYIIY
jgi:hypothetical protein